MWMQAQNLVPTGQITYDAPLGVLLVIGLLVVTGMGVLFESGAVAALLGWLAASPRHTSARVATAPHRS